MKGRILLLWVASVGLVGCGGGGGGGSGTSASGGDTPTAAPPGSTLVSAATPFAADCSGSDAAGTLYRNAEVEPQLAVNPQNPRQLIAVWQQDRWSDGGAQGLLTGISSDGGLSWTRQALPFSVCAGGSYTRASDPWISFAADGSTAYQIALAYDGQLLQPGSTSAVLLSRSTDAGQHWDAPRALIADTGGGSFNDKESVTADPGDARYAYACWDRLTTDNRGPVYEAHTSDGGASWSTARPVYDPGSGAQTIGNQVVVGADGSALLFFTELDGTTSSTVSAHYGLLRSSDHGASWSSPLFVAEALAVGTHDPQTGAKVRDGANLIAVATAPSGAVYAVWQDARFSGGSIDGIAFAQSGDGGQSWSTPVQINGAPDAAAFTPTVRVAADGTIAVSYFDLRDDSAGATLAEVWLATSADGQSWSERLLAGPFNLATAPNAGGYFLGDYAGLAAPAGGWLALFAQTTGVAANATELYAVPVAAHSTGVAARRFHARASGPLRIDAAFAARVSEALRDQWLDERSPPRRVTRRSVGD